jgi:hypothetical protein
MVRKRIAKVRQHKSVAKLTTAEAYRRLEQAYSTNVKLEDELQVLRRMAQSVHIRDWAGAEKFYDEWVTTVDNLPSKRRVYSPEYKYHVVRRYMAAEDGLKYKVCEYYKLDGALVMRWVAEFKAGGVDALNNWGRGGGGVTPSLKPPLPKQVSLPYQLQPEVPTKIVDKKCHIFLPKRGWEEVE